MPSNTVYDANFNPLNFNGAGSSGAANNFLNIVGTGKANGDIVRFNNVITINGHAVDAVVTTTVTNATISTYDSTANPSSDPAASPYFQPNMSVSTAGGGASFKIDFYEAGTYTGTGTGSVVTLQNVAVNSYDIDSSGGTDRQYQEFKGFSQYELANATSINTTTLSDGSVHFQATTAVNNSGTTLAALQSDGYRVKVYYDSISSFVVKSGVNIGTGTAYFALDFSVGPAWTGPTTIFTTPAPHISYSDVVLNESVTNDGSITTISTITLINETFTGTNGQPLTGVTFANVPAGLTAVVTRVDTTHATLSLTGNATAHANANDVSNLTVNFGNGAFSGGNAAAVTNASKSDLGINFADPAPVPALTYGTTVFDEALANDGSITTTSTITLANDTFTGTNGQPLTGVTFANVPAGLTAVVTRVDTTHATLSLTGNATAHANANDVSNLTVNFGNGAFSGGNAAAVTNASKSDLVVDFIENNQITATVSSVIISETSPFAVVKVSLSSASGTDLSFKPGEISSTATSGTDTSGHLEYFNGTKWLSATNGVTILAGKTDVLLRAQIINDNNFEGSESFQISTGAITGPNSNISAASGVVTLKDDGSISNVFMADNNSTTPTTGTANNDQQTLLSNQNVPALADNINNLQLENVVKIVSPANTCMTDWMVKLTGDAQKPVTKIASLNGTGNSLDNDITGNNGNNVLSGMDGNDTINGLKGNDVLIGGSGADTLTGGAGADVFRFLLLSDSQTGNSLHDVITDFKRGTDKIDLRSIDANDLVNGNQAFKLVKDFSNHAGQLHFDSATHLLQGDVNGDGTADFQIELTGITAISSANISL